MNENVKKDETKNKLISVISPAQSHYREGSPIGRSKVKVGRIYWKGRFWTSNEKVKEWWMMRVAMMTKMGWQVSEMIQTKMNLEVDSKGEVMHI